jgi:hypothetical protein
MFTGFLALPAHPLGERVIELDGAWPRAHGHTAATIPALLGIEHEKGLTASGIDYHDIS